MGEEKSGRSHLLPLLAIGAITSACGIALGLLIDWFPIAASEEAKDIDTLWDVLADRLGADLRARPDDRPLLRVAVPHAPGRGAQGRPADPRQHAARGDLDRDPRDHPRRAVLLRLRRPARHRGGRGLRDEGPRRRRAVHVDVLLPAATAARRSPPTSSTCPRASRSSSTSSPRTSCTTSGSPPSVRRSTPCRASPRASAIKPTKTGTFPVVCAELCGLGHSVMRQSAHVVSRTTSTSGSPDQQRQGGRRRRRRRGGGARRRRRRRGARRQDDLHERATPACGSCHTLADAGTTPPSARTSTRSSRARTRPSSRSRSRTRAPRSPRASRMGSCRRTTATPSSRRRSRR